MFKKEICVLIFSRKLVVDLIGLFFDWMTEQFLSNLLYLYKCGPSLKNFLWEVKTSDVVRRFFLALINFVYTGTAGYKTLVLQRLRYLPICDEMLSLFFYFFIFREMFDYYRTLCSVSEVYRRFYKVMEA